ncbi:TetR/AcrR family transcriptional regulator [Rhodococcus sp. NPDC003348]
MADGSDEKTSRLERRKARTRAALIRAAQTFIAEGTPNVPVLEITQAADVGMGSFYNHFESKEQLFQAAVDDAFEAHGDLLDRLTGDIEDPAEVFAQAFRLTGRLHRIQPELCRVLLANGSALITSDHGLAPRALRDIEAATAAGRFTVRDPQVALALAAGAAIGLGQLLHDQPDRDDAEATDQMTEDVLCAFGLPAEEAHRICRRPLPDVAAVAGSAA